jgi:AcrR family transcriptional regulator
MPRGVAIPRVREQLFAAADRVLTRDGPPGLSTRAVTAEAGVANGVLHRHFRDFDEFLASFAADRLQDITDTAAALPRRAGQGSVAGNLTDAAVAVFGASAQALMSLVTTRPDLGSVLEHNADRPGGLTGIEAHFAAYLDAEKKLGRIGPDSDTDALAFTLLGAVHHLVVIRRGDEPGLRPQVQRIVAVLSASMTSANQR